MISLSCEAEHLQAQEAIHAALAKSDSRYSHWPKQWKSKHCLQQEQSHPAWICLTWKANPNYTVSLTMEEISVCKYSYTSPILKYHQKKTSKNCCLFFFFSSIWLFWYTELLSKAGGSNHRAQCGLSGLCLHGWKGLRKIILCKDCLCLWQCFPLLTEQHSSYMCPVIPGRSSLLCGETSHWWGKCQGKITVKLFDALQWAIITTLSRKVDQLTEIHAWGIIVVKNTLLLMTFYWNFYSEGI